MNAAAFYCFFVAALMLLWYFKGDVPTTCHNCTHSLDEHLHGMYDEREGECRYEGCNCEMPKR